MAIRQNIDICGFTGCKNVINFKTPAFTPNFLLFINIVEESLWTKSNNEKKLILFEELIKQKTRILMMVVQFRDLERK